MIRKTLFTTVAAVSFITAAPDITHYIASDKANDTYFVVPDGSVKTRAPFAGLFVIDGAFKKVAYKVKKKRRIALMQSWPLCDSACQHFRKTSGANATDVNSLMVDNAQPATTSVDRTRKGDRLPQTSMAEQKQKFAPSTKIAPASLKRLPEGCDPAFSPVADPGRALIRMRCIA
jgi:hypothetical protein